MFYSFITNACYLYLKVFNKFIIKGQDNVPKDNSVVLVANHVSLWDPVILACSVERVVHFMAKEELFRVPILGRIIRNLNAFPIKRGKPDRGALRNASELLKKGNALGLFPEGTRSRNGELRSFQPGAALFALRSNAPIVPMALIGTKSTFPMSLRGKITVNIGRPLVYPHLYGKKISTADLERVTDDIIESITWLMKDV